jgi:DNA-binding NtrC family response regulator
MVAYDLRQREAYALKAILLVDKASAMVKIVEFYVKAETCVSDNMPSRSLTVTGGVADATYRLMVGDRSVMEGVSGASIRRDIGKREPDRPVTLITCYQDIDISGRSLTEFLLPILGAGEIGRRVESSINMFASEKV